jgi:hypothetical protein
MLHIEREDVRQSMHLTHGNKPGVMDLLTDYASCHRK